ncbi:hypothetical protein [Marinicrinis lubricantis]|uniref:Uncharacterized protein n=1 Tax=Marinicrinis lubricantis TaxID=2086470 RepID=A0ABW1IKR4_9BACL
MNKTTVLIKASFIQMRIYLWVILGAIAVSVISNTIVSLALGEGESSNVSYANFLSIFLLFAGSVLPSLFFKRVINLGASRKEYYLGLLSIYMVLSAVFAFINVIWLQVEDRVLGQLYTENLNILTVFHWDDFSIPGTFLYQFAVYLLLLSLLNLLFSGLQQVAGWVVWVIFIAAIPIFTSIPSLREILADGLSALLLNDSLLQGFTISIILSILLFAGGWWFTVRRPIA